MPDNHIDAGFFALLDATVAQDKIKELESRIRVLEAENEAYAKALDKRHYEARKAGGTEQWPAWWGHVMDWARVAAVPSFQRLVDLAPMPAPAELILPGVELGPNTYVPPMRILVRPYDLLNIETFCGKAEMWQGRAEYAMNLRGF